jgi:hypothetical protein
MDVHPPKNGINRYWSIASWRSWIAPGALNVSEASPHHTASEGWKGDAMVVPNGITLKAQSYQWCLMMFDVLMLGATCTILYLFFSKRCLPLVFHFADIEFVCWVSWVCGRHLLFLESESLLPPGAPTTPLPDMLSPASPGSVSMGWGTRLGTTSQCWLSLVSLDFLEQV